MKDVSAPPRLRVRLFFWSMLVATISTVVAREAFAQAQARLGAVDITIAVNASGSAHVEAQYKLAPSPKMLELSMLTRPCARVENIVLARAGVSAGFTESQNGPWGTWRDTTMSADTVNLGLSYDVVLGGDRSIPLLHPAAPLVRTEPGAVNVRVRFSDEGRVEFPHMTRAVGEWSGRYIAMPSFVKLGGAGNECAEVPSGDNGGLVWRFFLLIGIMVAWVPLYLSWARRTGENA